LIGSFIPDLSDNTPQTKRSALDPPSHNLCIQPNKPRSKLTPRHGNEKINSGKLRAIGCDARTCTLQVQLDNGNTLQHSNVSEDLWRRLSTLLSNFSFSESLSVNNIFVTIYS